MRLEAGGEYGRTNLGSGIFTNIEDSKQKANALAVLASKNIIEGLCTMLSALQVAPH